MAVVTVGVVVGVEVEVRLAVAVVLKTFDVAVVGAEVSAGVVTVETGGEVLGEEDVVELLVTVAVELEVVEDVKSVTLVVSEGVVEGMSAEVLVTVVEGVAVELAFVAVSDVEVLLSTEVSVDLSAGVEVISAVVAVVVDVVVEDVDVEVSTVSSVVGGEGVVVEFVSALIAEVPWVTEVSAPLVPAVEVLSALAEVKMSPSTVVGREVVWAVVIGADVAESLKVVDSTPDRSA